ncbi:hypothetical protein BDN67DRAFT_991913 [Paxillus ammoniavirescens]|nr:hypothetical protein BDN67DRAFT_991913 [Paxillus ammoniavirescens]
MSLVIWIAIFIKFLEALKVYMDNSYSYELLGNLLYCAPYDTWYLVKQTLLLRLWDEIGLPHEKPKQVFGDTLEIIGFVVNPNAMSVSFPPDKKLELICHLCKFAVPRKQWPLREFWKLASWVNWGLNVFPYLRPGFGKHKKFARIRVNLCVVTELLWIGILFFESLHWSPDTCEDVLILGLSFFLPMLNTSSPPENSIVFFEARALASMAVPPHCLAIYSDSTNTVDLFNTLCVSHPYNDILISAVDVLLHKHIDLQNHVTDALAHFHNAAAEVYASGIQINHFQPPQDALGA